MSVSPFVYADTATPRAGIDAVSARLAGGTIAIIGCGGNGSYILDLVAKTPVERILLIDGDVMEQHNAFRSPGAASKAEVNADMFKVDYFARIYGRMHAGIEAHAAHLEADNFDMLDAVDFAFLCVDSVEARAEIVPALRARDIPFIDTGIGLTLVDDQLMGMIRVTTSTPLVRGHTNARGRIPIETSGADIYRSNIQISDMNALAAALAVMRWKRLRGFYLDLEGEYHATFAVDGNHMLNEDHRSAEQVDG